MSTGSSSSTLVTALQKKLGIQWKGAVRLLDQAKANCEIPEEETPFDREDEVLEEACELFADLSPSEQEALKVRDPSEPQPEPEWKQKALRAAEKRQAEREAQAAAEAANEKVRQRLREQGVPDAENTKVVVIRKMAAPESAAGEEKAGPKVTKRTHTCVCTIL